MKQKAQKHFVPGDFNSIVFFMRICPQSRHHTYTDIDNPDLKIIVKLFITLPTIKRDLRMRRFLTVLMLGLLIPSAALEAQQANHFIGAMVFIRH
nr:hypothetical protein [uncultured Mucilaginibacter sp.]